MSKEDSNAIFLNVPRITGYKDGKAIPSLREWSKKDGTEMVTVTLPSGIFLKDENGAPVCDETGKTKNFSFYKLDVTKAQVIENKSGYGIIRSLNSTTTGEPWIDTIYKKAVCAEGKWERLDEHKVTPPALAAALEEQRKAFIERHPQKQKTEAVKLSDKAEEATKASEGQDTIMVSPKREERVA